MPIEVRELLIRSTVQQDGGGDTCANGEGETARDDQELKEDILVECRKLVLELLAERRER